MESYIVRVFSDGKIAVHKMIDGIERTVTFTEKITLGNVEIESRHYPLR